VTHFEHPKEPQIRNSDAVLFLDLELLNKSFISLDVISSQIVAWDGSDNTFLSKFGIAEYDKLFWGHKNDSGMGLFFNTSHHFDLRRTFV
jgi:hypothetical protein